MDTARNAINLVSYFVIPLMLVGFPLYGLYKRVPVYESFVEGAKEGFQVAVRIIPYLVAILFADRDVPRQRRDGCPDPARSSPVLGRSASRPSCCRWPSSGRSRLGLGGARRGHDQAGTARTRSS